MSFVLDASATIAWLLDASHRQAAQAWTRMADEDALVPTLWWFEVRNGLVVNERRGRITERETTGFLRDVSRLAIVIDRTPDESAVLNLARRHRLTVYDAAYLELALRTESPLATLDSELSAAARGERVSLVGDGL